MRILRQVRDAQDGTATLLGLQVTDETPVWTNDILGYASPDGWTKEFKRTARQAGYPELTLHSLRHAHATALVELGGPPEDDSTATGSRISGVHDERLHLRQRRVGL